MPVAADSDRREFPPDPEMWAALKEGEPAVQAWLSALKAGGTLPPVEFAALAGVDITTDVPLRNTIATIGQMIDQIERLG